MQQLPTRPKASHRAAIQLDPALTRVADYLGDGNHQAARGIAGTLLDHDPEGAFLGYQLCAEAARRTGNRWSRARARAGMTVARQRLRRRR